MSFFVSNPGQNFQFVSIWYSSHLLLANESWWWWWRVIDRKAWHAAIHGSQRVGHDWVTERNWTKLNDSWFKMKHFAMSVQWLISFFHRFYTSQRRFNTIDSLLNNSQQMFLITFYFLRDVSYLNNVKTVMY